VPRVIVLDTFPLSSTAKPRPRPDEPTGELDRCREWVRKCVSAGHQIVAPAIAYYEALRELERRGAARQIERLRAFCQSEPGRYLPLTDENLNHAARLWAKARNDGMPTAAAEALDGDVILAAQVLSLQCPDDVVVATSNVGHLSRFVAAERWTDISP
jgi:hypothetical protein